jgi:prevent-host-death family protein
MDMCHDVAMKETMLPASEFKTKCLRLLDEVAEHGDTLVITKRGRPIAKVSPLAANSRRLRGTWKGLVKGNQDVVYFDAGDDWESAQ